MAAIFNATDERIPALHEFVQEVAAALSDGQPLASAVRSAGSRHTHAREAFDLTQSDIELENNFALNDNLTFPNETLPAVVRFSRGRNIMSLKVTAGIAGDLSFLLSTCATGRRTADEIRDEFEEPFAGFVDSLLESGMIVEGTPPPALNVPTLSRPGVTRLQHAGLFYRGTDCGLLVDPHLQSSYEPYGLDDSFVRAQFEGLVDAILISHSHRDHWHLPTLMTFPRDTVIVVPKAPRASMLCPDFEKTLRALGFMRIMSLGWYDPPVRVGDLEIHACPFYGEQPLLREAPRHPDLRNHGNTYVVRHARYTSWFLIDSGNDWMGRMAEVANEVKRRFGSIDLLLSNLKEFPIYTPLYITGGHYWLSLSPDQLRRFSSMRNDVITLGPRGVAEICHIVKAQKFLPYAHWWGKIGEPPDPEEVAAIDALERHLTTFGANTEIVPWRVGESYVP